ncbi:DNA topoisomerase family protein [Trichomonas vaginalis G3]|uniref:DNA topoisomerase n=1 Tax=Trichomonas vaginalis (strain ATCC PRA-98 / G3) TaxID=412133 RepID=A2DNF5_TRIV3|nr:prokaryotic DNA topoisomerase family [Trichomonas vaginalis G3]EAY18143.1 DNA topoisomerase family protein [Trichomonas vaginalis G3]KAI5492420.1 prokaryotic DNA topoisomerase family [Trichomonas vaginalis G3]|eukprot:XP_001579129.1 DNA topoisomerase family protein [Trichomonas vaginalis G3]
MPKKILCVAEKPSVAREAAKILSNGHMETKKGKSKFNNNFVFQRDFQGEDVKVVFTSVAGHVLNYCFPPECKNWQTFGNTKLFDCQLNTCITANMEKVVGNLQTQAKKAFLVFLWLDNDREGEGISEEVEEICKQVNENANYKRARFSGLSPREIIHAFNNPTPINRNDAAAVKLRQEIDLRIGSAFTRFQSQFKGMLQNAELISFGPCQFPTLGFVVEAFFNHIKHVPESFWKIEPLITKDNIKVTLKWDRKRLFCKLSAFAIYVDILDNPMAKVLTVDERESLSNKPLPLSTIELQRRCSKYLKISAQRSMEAAEKLYQNGCISYPRTETDSFSADFKFKDIVNALTRFKGEIGQYSNKILQQIVPPRAGKHSDNAHPPIYPIKVPDKFDTPDQQKVFEFVCRHFLACCSKDGVSLATRVTFDINGEQFHLKGTRVLEENWHEIYPYIPFKGTKIPEFKVDELISPTNIELNEGKTTAPPLLTEPDLLKKMNQEGIGTDATYQDHIAKIMERKYIVQENNYFKPTPLGLALNDGYEGMGFDFMKPRLRAEMEQGLQDISSGRQTYDAVRNNFIKQYRDAYVTAERMYDVLTREFTRQKNNPYNAPLPVEEQASKRSKSKSDGKTKKKKSSSSKSTKSSKTSKSSKSSKSSKTATTSTRKP